MPIGKTCGRENRTDELGRSWCESYADAKSNAPQAPPAPVRAAYVGPPITHPLNVIAKEICACPHRKLLGTCGCKAVCFRDGDDPIRVTTADCMTCVDTRLSNG